MSWLGGSIFLIAMGWLMLGGILYGATASTTADFRCWDLGATPLTNSTACVLPDGRVVFP